MSIFGALLSPAVMIATSAICAIIAGQKSSRAFYLFKPLTTVMIILYGLLALESLNDRRGIAVIIGLLFSLCRHSEHLLPVHIVPRPSILIELPRIFWNYAYVFRTFYQVKRTLHAARNETSNPSPMGNECFLLPDIANSNR